MRRPVVVVDKELKMLGLNVLYSVCNNIKVEHGRVDIRVFCENIISKSVNSLTRNTLLEHPIIRAYREFLWRVGINASRYKVISEYILRRVLKGRNLGNYSNLAELMYTVIIEELIPLAILDITHAKKPLIIRYSRPGEVIEISGGRVMELNGREVVISDSGGNIMFIFPSKYIHKYGVNDDTENIIVLGYSVPKVPRALVQRAIKKFIQYLSMFYHEVSCTDVRECS